MKVTIRYCWKVLSLFQGHLEPPILFRGSVAAGHVRDRINMGGSDSENDVGKILRDFVPEQFSSPMVFTEHAPPPPPNTEVHQTRQVSDLCWMLHLLIS